MAENVFGIAGATIIGGVAIDLGTYKMPPLCAIAAKKSNEKLT
jgi:hypothetical protein